MPGTGRIHWMLIASLLLLNVPFLLHCITMKSNKGLLSIITVEPMPLDTSASLSDALWKLRPVVDVQWIWVNVTFLSSILNTLSEQMSFSNEESCRPQEVQHSEEWAPFQVLLSPLGWHSASENFPQESELYQGASGGVVQCSCWSHQMSLKSSTLF